MNYVARKRCTCLSSTTIFANRIVPGQVHLPRYPRPYAPACRPLTSIAVKDGGLRGSSVSLDQGAVGLLYRSGKPALDIQQHPFLVGGDVGLHRLDHQVPRHAVEELGDV